MTGVQTCALPIYDAMLKQMFLKVVAHQTSNLYRSDYDTNVISPVPSPSLPRSLPPSLSPPSLTSLPVSLFFSLPVPFPSSLASSLTLFHSLSLFSLSLFFSLPPCLLSIPSSLTLSSLSLPPSISSLCLSPSLPLFPSPPLSLSLSGDRCSVEINESPRNSPFC